MFVDKYGKALNDNSTISVEMNDSGRYNLPRHWEVIDTIINADGTSETRNYFNTVVDDCSKVIASLMMSHKGYKGIAYWAVGKGSTDWSNETPPLPNLTDSKLVAETFRKEILPENIEFLDESNKVTDQVTNKLQISVVFNEGEANGELREFGLFGGDATHEAQSGLMINHKIHPLIYKTSGMQLKRTIRITF